MPELIYDRAPNTSIRVYRRESDGAIMVEGDPIAEGVMDYDGVRELITPEAVAAYRPHIAHLTVTLGHPDVEVTPDNVSTYGAGNTDGEPEIVTQPGGWTAVRAKHIFRRRDAVDAAEAHMAGGAQLKGFSLGHIPIRDNVSGVHPQFGPYDRRRIGVVAVNHNAICGDSDALPPPRGKNCGIYLDSKPASPAKVTPMKRKEARAILLDAANAAQVQKARGMFAAVAAVTDAVSIDKAIPMLKELAADPIGILVLRAMVSEGAEPEEPEEVMIEEADPEVPPMDPAAMDARIVLALAPLKAELDALKAARTAADAAEKATRDAAELSRARTLAASHGLLTADADRPACIAHLRRALAIDANVSDDSVLAVATFAGKLPAPSLRILDSNPGAAFASTEI